MIRGGMQPISGVTTATLAGGANGRNCLREPFAAIGALGQHIGDDVERHARRARTRRAGRKTRKPPGRKSPGCLEDDNACTPPGTTLAPRQEGARKPPGKVSYGQAR